MTVTAQFRYVLFFIYTQAIITGCQIKNAERVTTPFKADTIEYVVENNSTRIIKDMYVIGKPSTQQLVVQVKLQNPMDRSAVLNFDNFETGTRDGRRAVAALCSPPSVHLPAGESVTVHLVFEPFHDLRLFQETGMRGDLHDEYVFRLLGEPGFEEEVRVRIADRKNYDEMVSRYGAFAKTNPYVPSPSVSWLGSQKQYADSLLLHKPVRTESTVNVAGNEILVNGVWMKVEARGKDSLHLKLRFVNKSGFTLLIDPLEMRVTTGEKTFKPISSSGAARTIPDGARDTLNLLFSTRPNEAFVFDMKGITVTKDNVRLPVFHSGIEFIKYASNR